MGLCIVFHRLTRVTIIRHGCVSQHFPSLLQFSHCFPFGILTATNSHVPILERASFGCIFIDGGMHNIDRLLRLSLARPSKSTAMPFRLLPAGAGTRQAVRAHPRRGAGLAPQSPLSHSPGPSSPDGPSPFAFSQVIMTPLAHLIRTLH